MKVLSCKNYLFIILSIFLVFVISSPSTARKKKKDSLTGLSPAEDAGIRLLAMQQKGYINLVLIEPNPILFVEPLAWKNMTHHDKVKLGNLALLFVNGLKQKEGKKYNYDYVFIKDMTTKEHLGTVYLNENRVEIFK